MTGSKGHSQGRRQVIPGVGGTHRCELFQKEGPKTAWRSMGSHSVSDITVDRDHESGGHEVLGGVSDHYLRWTAQLGGTRANHPYPSDTRNDSRNPKVGGSNPPPLVRLQNRKAHALLSRWTRGTARLQNRMDGGLDATPRACDLHSPPLRCRSGGRARIPVRASAALAIWTDAQRWHPSAVG